MSIIKAILDLRPDLPSLEPSGLEAKAPLEPKAPFVPMRRAGALRNGAERGKGSIWHAVKPSQQNGGKALCGVRAAIMWTEGGAEITCPRCKKLALTCD